MGEAVTAAELLYGMPLLRSVTGGDGGGGGGAEPPCGTVQQRTRDWGREERWTWAWAWTWIVA